MAEKPDSLFLVGNGFDIAHGIPSGYNEFRKYLIKRYPEAFEFRDERIYMEDLDNLDPEEFSAEILLSAMDKVEGDNWINFESSLAKIDFSNKFPVPCHKVDETEEEDNSLMRGYLLYMDKLSSVFITCAEEWWQIFFQKWIREVQIPIKKENYNSKSSLRKLFSDNKMLYFSFNYTKTLEKLYGIREVTHIHNYVGQKLVFGHGEDNAIYEEKGEQSALGSSFLDEMVMAFRKNTDMQMIRYKKFFKQLDSNISKVYSYGFSYGRVDGVYIKRIIKNISPTAKWYFTEFEARNSEALRIKKVKLRNYGFKGKFDVYEG